MFPPRTPKPLAIGLFGLIGLSLFSPWLGPYLALSRSAVSALHLWQFLTYGIFEPAPLGLTFSFFVHLAFNGYLLWAFGTSLAQKIGLTSFGILCLTALLVGGVSAYGAMAIFQTTSLYAGLSPLLYATLIPWAVFHPHAQLLFFFAIPFQANWLIFGLIGFNLLADLSLGNWIACASYAGASFYAYLFSLYMARPRKKPSLRTYSMRSKVPVLSDEEFMDNMLSRISRYGERFLTVEEKKRMQEISERRAQKPKSS